MIFYWMYRKFVYYQSGKHSYDFCFYLLENGQPKAGVTFTLVRKNAGQQMSLANQLL